MPFQKRLFILKKHVNRVSKRPLLRCNHSPFTHPKHCFENAIAALSPTQSTALRMQELPFYKTKTSLLPFWSIIGLAHSGISSSIFAKLSKEKARFPSNKNWQKSFGHATPAIPIPQRGIAKSALRQQVFERWRNKKAARAFTRAAEYRFKINPLLWRTQDLLVVQVNLVVQIDGLRNHDCDNGKWNQCYHSF